MDYDVKEVQGMLKDQGFDPGPVDGIWGPRTAAAVIAFKRSIGFRPRDYVGPLTYAALKEGSLPDTHITNVKLTC